MAEGPEAARKPRLHGAVRSAIIVYGIAAYTFLFPRPVVADEPAPTVATAALQMLLIGIGLQVLVLLVRRLVPRESAATALDIFELIVDGATVLLFALATYQGLLRHAASI